MSFTRESSTVPSMLRQGGAAIDPAAVRRHILGMAYRANTPHIACAFSLVELLTTLYNHFLRVNPEQPEDPERDILILSKGHGVMAQYACYRELGWLKEEQLAQYGTDGSSLHGICEYKTPAFEVSSGSLGHGLPIAVGMALGLKRLGKGHRKVYCIVGDGEMNEGPMWESLLFAGHHRLDNLVVIVDANAYQAMGRIEDVLSLEPFCGKFEAFGFHALECDGHDLAALRASLAELHQDAASGRPKALVARTIKGKGVSYMEANNLWHYARLTPELLDHALKEIQQS